MKPKRRLYIEWGAIFKWVAIVLGVLILLAGAFIGYSVINHRAKVTEEKEYLANFEVGGVTDVDGLKVNYKLFNQGKTAKTLVFLSGLNVQDSALALQPLAAELSDTRLVVINRPGYAGSDDTSAPATVDFVVDFYRSALKAIKIDGPVYLMPHSVGGMYAMHWAEKYPSEVRGIIGLDIGAPENYLNSDYATSKGFQDWFFNLGAKLGLHRLFVLNESALKDNVNQLFETGNYDESTAWAMMYLGMANAYPDFVASESGLLQANARAVIDARSDNYQSIKKLFILADQLSYDASGASAAEQELYRRYQADNKAALSGENTEIITFSAPHALYTTNIPDLASALRNFTN